MIGKVEESAFYAFTDYRMEFASLSREINGTSGAYFVVFTHFYEEYRHWQSFLKCSDLGRTLVHLFFFFEIRF